MWYYWYTYYLLHFKNVGNKTYQNAEIYSSLSCTEQHEYIFL